MEMMFAAFATIVTPANDVEIVLEISDAARNEWAIFFKLFSAIRTPQYFNKKMGKPKKNSTPIQCGRFETVLRQRYYRFRGPNPEGRR
jgi:hypothetical protein